GGGRARLRVPSPSGSRRRSTSSRTGPSRRRSPAPGSTAGRRRSRGEPGASAMTRDEVLAALDVADLQVRSRLRPESDERFEDWTAKDLLCHLSAWQRFFGQKLRVQRELGREATASEMLGRQLD